MAKTAGKRGAPRPNDAHRWIDARTHELLKEATRLIDVFWGESNRLYREQVQDSAKRRTNADGEPQRSRLTVRARIVNGSLQIEWLEIRPKFLLGITGRTPAPGSRAPSPSIVVAHAAQKSRDDYKVIFRPIAKRGDVRYHRRTLASFARDWQEGLVQAMEDKFAELRKQARRLGRARRFISEYEKAVPLVHQELARADWIRDG